MVTAHSHRLLLRPAQYKLTLRLDQLCGPAMRFDGRGRRPAALVQALRELGLLELVLVLGLVVHEWRSLLCRCLLVLLRLEGLVVGGAPIVEGLVERRRLRNVHTEGVLAAAWAHLDGLLFLADITRL